MNIKSVIQIPVLLYKESAFMAITHRAGLKKRSKVFYTFKTFSTFQNLLKQHLRFENSIRFIITKTTQNM